MIENESALDVMLFDTPDGPRLKANGTEIEHGMMIRAEDDYVPRHIWPFVISPERLDVVRLSVFFPSLECDSAPA